MKNQFLALLLSIICFSTFAQQTEDVIYLNNGSIIRGKIVENIPDSIVKIQSNDRNIWVFKHIDISNTTHEKAIHRNEKYLENKSGYTIITDMGLFLPLKETSTEFISLGMIHSYNFLPNLSTGIGINLDLDKQTYIPIYFDIHYYINRRYFAPFLQFSIGHAFPKEKDTEIEYRNLNNLGGIYCITSFGMEFAQNENLSLLLNFTYRYQQNSYKSKPNEEYYELIDKNYRFAIKIGLLFR